MKDFEINVNKSEKSFIENLKGSESDAAIVCLSSYHKNKINKFLEMESFTGCIPLLSCTRTLKADFISQAADKGIRRFLSNDMELDQVIILINNSIKQNDLRKFIERKFPGCFERTIYAKKIVDIITHTFPKRLSEDEISDELTLSKGWFQHECKKAFDINYKKLIRVIWIYQALRLLYKTDFPINEIASQLNYNYESSMARDFKKELNISPNEVRKKLSTINPDEFFILK